MRNPYGDKIMIVFIRHGATLGNLEKKYIGITDEPLCPQGKKYLQDHASLFPSVNQVFVSPMRRCRETAAILYPKLEQIIVPDFRECNFGLFEGKTYEMLKEEPEYIHWLETGGESPFPVGESRTQFTKRCTEAFLQLIPQFQKDIAIVAHGGTLMALLSSFGKGNFYDWHTKNGNGFQAEFDGEHFLNIRPLRE
ncbi:MAG: histidine phosphatase family protein [Oscillospiraceae bacterium]|nr:histidine phosphatase family protein [Oscillospiraceae bacterium]